MSTSTRQLVVDDSDPRIRFSSSWFSSNDAMANLGNFGSTFNSTQHGTNGTGSFQFDFSGTQISVFGTPGLQINPVGHEPSWECFVGDVSIGATNPFQFPENNWNLCSVRGLPDRNHTLTVKAQSNGPVFYFDYLRYLPSTSVPLENEVVYVDHTDSQIRYGSGWQALGTTANMTMLKGSSVDFKFIGTSLSWYGMIPNELPNTPSIGTYSVDGEVGTTFTLPGLPDHNASTVYNQRMFKTPILPHGPHNITVTFGGDIQSTPFNLGFLIIQNGTGTQPNSIAKLVPTASGLATSGSTRTSVGGIVGGVLAALAVVALALVTFLVLKRRKRHQARMVDANNTIPIPFYINRDSGSHSISSSRPLNTVLYNSSPNQVARSLPPSRDDNHSRLPLGAGTPQPLTFENLRALDPNARVIETAVPLTQEIVSQTEDIQPVNPSPHRPQDPSHHRRRSRGRGANQQAQAGPSRLQPLSPIERDAGANVDDNAAYGGYRSQTRGQMKALEAAAERKRNKPRDSYM